MIFYAYTIIIYGFIIILVILFMALFLLWLAKIRSKNHVLFSQQKKKKIVRGI